jgi:DNA-binding transcriptional ArsR family regulator
VTDDLTDTAAIAALRSLAHPVRVRIMSLLTAEAMSAAEVARALGLTHANASYHLRVLHEAGELVVEGEEKIRGGVAKRYRYDVGRHATPRPGQSGTSAQARIADLRATAVEVERRLHEVGQGPATYSDLETWVPVAVWHEALELLLRASRLLHTEARPAGTADTVHVSATSMAFTMAGGLAGEATRWRP